MELAVGTILVIHDLLTPIGVDGQPPSFEPGAKERAVEMFSMSKVTISPVGAWDFGEMPKSCGAPASKLLIGIFQPLQVDAVTALNGPQDGVAEIVDTYRRRRDTLGDGLSTAGWKIPRPQGTIFVWARLPEKYQHLGSLEFSRLLLSEAKVTVSPGASFRPFGEGYVRFALFEVLWSAGGTFILEPQSVTAGNHISNAGGIQYFEHVEVIGVQPHLHLAGFSCQ
jgi:alanine-synthesizing transaminase